MSHLFIEIIFRLLLLSHSLMMQEIQFRNYKPPPPNYFNKNAHILSGLMALIYIT